MATYNKDAYLRLGQALLQRHQEQLDTQLLVLRQALASFASDHADEIASNPEFLAKFTQMCLLAEVDPLEMLLVARTKLFHLALAVKLMEVCQKTTHINGGLIAVDALIKQFAGEEVPLNVTETDITKAVGVLSSLGPGYLLVPINNQTWLKYLSATDLLLADQRKIFELCQFMGGYVTHRLLRDNYGWDPVRCTSVVDEMILRGLLWIDYGPPGLKETLFWK